MTYEYMRYYEHCDGRAYTLNHDQDLLCNAETENKCSGSEGWHF